MTQDAQDALKGVMDIYSIHNRFCLICNNIEKISDALKSRCLPIKFTTPTKDSIRQKLVQIIEKEKINITDEALNILTLVNKDLRSWGVYAGIPAKRLKSRSKNLLKLEREFFY